MADYDGIKRDQNALRFKVVRAPLRFFLRASRQNRRERERERVGTMVEEYGIGVTKKRKKRKKSWTL